MACYGRNKEDALLQSALEALNASADGEETSVLLLGRHLFSKPDNLARLSSIYPKLRIKFMTVHGSNGLEAD